MLSVWSLIVKGRKFVICVDGHLAGASFPADRVFWAWRVERSFKARGLSGRVGSNERNRREGLSESVLLPFVVDDELIEAVSFW